MFYFIKKDIQAQAHYSQLLRLAQFMWNEWIPSCINVFRVILILFYLKNKVMSILLESYEYFSMT